MSESSRKDTGVDGFAELMAVMGESSGPREPNARAQAHDNDTTANASRAINSAESRSPRDQI